MTLMNTQIVLANRPTGWVQESDFRVVRSELPTLKDGEFLVKNHWLSLDPYMRGRMSDAKSYAAPTPLGGVMIGGTVGEITESKNASFAKGDFVVAPLGWQQYGVSNGTGAMKVDPRLPLSVYLGVVGMPGVTAWLGLYDIGAPKSGETVVVSAAAGAVGGTVGQLAKFRGARAVGIAGGKAKCDYVVKELGFDVCVDYKSPSFIEELADATPSGIDVNFENVGGPVLDAVLARLNPFARVALCGLVSQYNATTPYAVKNFSSLLTNRVKVQGFIVSEHMDRWPVALKELSELVASKKLRYSETIAEGLEMAPRAFIGMLKGDNVGKQVVKLV